jgi:hypothetical protein
MCGLPDHHRFPLRSDGQRFPVVGRISNLGKLNFSVVLIHQIDDLLERHAEVFLPEVDKIYSVRLKRLVNLLLKRRRIIGPDDRVNVETERNRRTPHLLDAVHRIEPARHPNLENVRPEGSFVRQDVNVAESRQLSLRDRSLLAVLRLEEK